LAANNDFFFPRTYMKIGRGLLCLKTANPVITLACLWVVTACRYRLPLATDSAILVAAFPEGRMALA
jgi:hypothetical protein